MTRDMALLILGLGPRDGTVEEVTAAFRQRTGLWHPDKHGGDPQKTEVMRAIVEAKAVLLGGARPEPVEEVEEDPAADLEEALREYMNAVAGERRERRAQGRMEGRCRATTSLGERCSRKAMKGNYGFCHIHRR